MEANYGETDGKNSSIDRGANSKNCSNFWLQPSRMDGVSNSRGLPRSYEAKSYQGCGSERCDCRGVEEADIRMAFEGNGEGQFDRSVSYARVENKISVNQVKPQVLITGGIANCVRT